MVTGHCLCQNWSDQDHRPFRVNAKNMCTREFFVSAKFLCCSRILLQHSRKAELRAQVHVPTPLCAQTQTPDRAQLIKAARRVAFRESPLVCAKSLFCRGGLCTLGRIAASVISQSDGAKRLYRPYNSCQSIHHSISRHSQMCIDRGRDWFVQ